MVLSSRRQAGLAALARVWRSTRDPANPSIGELAGAVPRLLGARLRGSYRDVSWGRLALMAAGTAYILSPIDLMPEALLTVFGLADDAVVAVWVTGALLDETARFVEWERSRVTVPGETD
ncbi:MAG TPA: YkvA family protein [Actinomycetes bacterium]|nr:YkvA family protein [Actinomycetes bacterium]